MKKNTKIIIIVTIGIIAITFGIFFILSSQNKGNSGERTIRLQNLKYSELEKTLGFFEEKYQDYNISKVESFTHLYSNMYLRLLSADKFENLYTENKVKLIEGKFPKNKKEVIIPYQMKSGEELSYYLDNEGYNIGDKIKVNLTPYRTKVLTNKDTNNIIDVEIKYNTYCSIRKLNESKPYVPNDAYTYEEYTVVGFYKLEIYDGNYSIILKDDMMIDAITLLEDKNMKADDRLNVNIKLKDDAYLMEDLEKIIVDLRKEYDRYDESESSDFKTCNDYFGINFKSEKEIKEIYG